jgi:YebC/PmpR family DNA-binding regulatory protein
MAGHSKWANIKHRKSKQDALKAKHFTRHIREITTAARMGGGDIDSNPRLRLAIEKARGADMSGETIKRAIARGAGGAEADNLEEIVYEGYGPNGVAVMVECLTDNRNRTVGEVRHAFTKSGGNLGMTGSVGYLFKQTGLLLFPEGADENKILEIAMEAGADDVVTADDGSIEVTTSPEQFEAVRAAMEQAKVEASSAEVTMIAATKVKVENEDAEKMMKLIDTLEELDDVQNVHSNAEFSDEFLDKLS